MGVVKTGRLPHTSCGWIHGGRGCQDEDCHHCTLFTLQVAMDTGLLLLLEGNTGTYAQVLSGPAISSGEVSVLNLTANRWLRFNTSNIFPSRRDGAQVTADLGNVYLFGGRDEE